MSLVNKTFKYFYVLISDLISGIYQKLIKKPIAFWAPTRFWDLLTSLRYSIVKCKESVTFRSKWQAAILDSYCCLSLSCFLSPFHSLTPTSISIHEEHALSFTAALLTQNIPMCPHGWSSARSDPLPAFHVVCVSGIVSVFGGDQ